MRYENETICLDSFCPNGGMSETEKDMKISEDWRRHTLTRLESIADSLSGLILRLKIEDGETVFEDYDLLTTVGAIESRIRILREEIERKRKAGG